MTALALRRQREQNLQNESGSSCMQMSPKNAFRKFSQSLISQPTKVGPLVTQKSLRPTLKVSKPIWVTLEENIPAISMSQAQETTSSIGSTFWSGDAEHPKWPDICNLVPASPSWTLPGVVIRSKHNREVAKNTNFDWEAWTSKKTWVVMYLVLNHQATM